MDETLNSVDAEQSPVVEGQTEVEVTTGESESAAPAEQPVAEKPKQTPEENAKFKALRLEERQRAEQAAEDRVFETLASENGWKKLDGTPIKTKADYESAKADAQKYETLLTQGKTEAEARAEVRADQAERRLAEIEQKAQLDAKLAQERAEFYADFKEENGRAFNPETDQLPEEFWELVKNGKTLSDAYAKWTLKQHREKAKQVEAGKKTMEANASNATTTTGSVTGQGQADNSVLTDEIINSMTDKQRMERWGDIKKFYNMK